ncbi:hypothetical protein [Blattabacterium cuenoti]|uniref:hypothetical protein n=1 Tax=Blattabacterium cuenoti TaxID=1653831 RepID=UPI00163D2DA8|nr:hypothetical protein [Blattabacterium cuenoti]
MNFLKYIKAPMNTEPVDRMVLEKLSKRNIYEVICILEKISREISSRLKNDLDRKLEEFSIMNKNHLEEIFENKEQIELSKFYEKLPKPTSISLQYFLDGKIKIKSI